MEASSEGKHEYRSKGDESSTGHVWAAARFHRVMVGSCLGRVLKLMNCSFNLFLGPWYCAATGTVDTGTGARLDLLGVRGLTA
jgi:hypothetical protein